MAKEHFKFDFEEWMAEELFRRDDWKDWYEAMPPDTPLWEVNTIERVAMFIAQCGHESAGFRVLTENLNYSAKALNTIFPKYFRRAGRDANDYLDSPGKIANVIMLIGWTMAIVIQETVGVREEVEFYNLQEDTITPQFAKAMEMTAEEAVDYVRTKKGALDPACWSWDTNNINKWCDDMDVVEATKRTQWRYNRIR